MASDASRHREPESRSARAIGRATPSLGCTLRGTSLLAKNGRVRPDGVLCAHAVWASAEVRYARRRRDCGLSWNIAAKSADTSRAVVRRSAPGISPEEKAKEARARSFGG